ncbi:MAG: sn-glycerol-3-phosphate ABC transporter ATP-binding protein UgpC [Proteobacteria bacterium]|nr:sn-glycerol-3-phosphate ABC transporter ATP-binding protein UgpC [Pseudomonadota bacterium]
MAGLALSAVNKSFGSIGVIHGIDFTIEDGEFIVFVGPSGCGKSTLLRLIAGLDGVSGGSIFIDDIDVTEVEPAERGVSMVFQSYALYPHMSVYDNMGFGLKMNGLPKNEIDDRVQKAAKILGLDPLLDRKPKTLSGGQRQRVAIGRSIVREPKVFLLDEPLSNLDAELRVQMRIELAKLHKSLNSTMIYVTHDQTEAMTLADRIVVLRAGIVEQIGSPIDLYDNPDNQFVAGFIGSPRMNFVNGVVQSSRDDLVKVKIGILGDIEIEVKARDLSPENRCDVLVGLRPEHFLPSDQSEDVFTGQIGLVEQMGGLSYLYIDAGDERLTIEQAGHSSKKSGDSAQIGINASKALLFTTQGQRI